MRSAFHRAVEFAIAMGWVIALGLADVPGALASTYPPLDPASPVIGMLESDPSRIDATNMAGARAVVVGVGWGRYEPQEGVFDHGYAESLREKIAAYRAGGKLVVLDLGVQYPPRWALSGDSSHFFNQYGEPFEPGVGQGDCGVNLVFSQAERDKFNGYLARLFADLGNDFFAVRLGGGRYGELGYPTNRYKAHDNCYWAFDPIAQGQKGGLPAGEMPSPVPGWIPGTPSPNHQSARLFLDWYMESMRNYHDWQIATARRYFAGPLFMLYPSTGGLRPGQLEAAVEDDCDGSTGPEKTGEVGRGYDTARFIAGIGDAQVVVYSTWIDGFPGWDDTSADPARWNPAHFLETLASAHRPPLRLGGENTGHPDDPANLEVTFQRLRDEHLCVMFWAFERTLFDGKKPHATIDDFKKSALVESGKWR